MVEDRKKRDITFDMMKGIGILLMLIGHVWAAYIPYIHKVIYSFHMPLFLIVAGYFSKPYSSDNNNKSAIYSYFRRLLPESSTYKVIILWEKVTPAVRRE